MHCNWPQFSWVKEVDNIARVKRSQALYLRRFLHHNTSEVCTAILKKPIYMYRFEHLAFWRTSPTIITNCTLLTVTYHRPRSQVINLQSYVSAKNEGWSIGCNQWWLLAGVALLIGGTGIVATTLIRANGYTHPEDVWNSLRFISYFYRFRLFQ